MVTSLSRIISSASLLLLGVLTTSQAQSSSAVPNGALGAAYQWSLVFEDDYSAASVDATKWAPYLYWGITSNGGFENLSNSEWYFAANRSVAPWRWLHHCRMGNDAMQSVHSRGLRR